MASVESVVKRSLRILGIIQTGESLSSDEAEDATQVLNEMLFGWELKGISLDHQDLDYSGTIPYGDDHLEAITYNLAVLLSDEYGKTVGELTFLKASSSFDRLLKSYGERKEPTYDNAIDDPKVNPSWYTF